MLITVAMSLGRFDVREYGSVIGEIKPGMEVKDDTVNARKRGEEKALEMERSGADRKFDLDLIRRGWLAISALLMGLAVGCLVAARFKWSKVGIEYLVGAGVAMLVGQLVFGFILESLLLAWIAQWLGYILAVKLKLPWH